MKKVGKLARRYARALLNSAEAELGRDGEPTPGQKLAAELGAFAQVWENDPELSTMMLSPMFAEDERKDALMKVAATAGVSEMVQRFLTVLFERGRIGVLPEIALGFAQLADASAGVVQVGIVVAREIDAGEQSQIENALRSQIDGTPRFSWSVDGELLGGMIVSFGGRVIDGSLSGRLAKIERELTN